MRCGDRAPVVESALPGLGRYAVVFDHGRPVVRRATLEVEDHALRRHEDQHRVGAPGGDALRVAAVARGPAGLEGLEPAEVTAHGIASVDREVC